MGAGRHESGGWRRYKIRTSTVEAVWVDVKGGLIGTSPVYETLTQTMGSALVGMVFVEEGVVSQRMI